MIDPFLLERHFARYEFSVRYPATWRTELAKVQYTMLKDLTRTDNWGSPLIFDRSVVKKSKGYYR